MTTEVINVSAYVALRKKELEAFEKDWISNHASDPENYLSELDEEFKNY